jgi:hypothetical protein
MSNTSSKGMDGVIMGGRGVWSIGNNDEEQQKIK